MTKLVDVVDSQGRRVKLGARLGQGGEGAVFEVVTDAKTVAKIYHNPLTKDRADKIQMMTRMRSEQICNLTAWPVTLLSQNTGEPIGLVMPKVVGHKDIHHLYSPKSRRTDFQRANWQFLIRAATNVARAFALVHDSGCVIGDVNPGGVLVAQDARVRLIDCDSFQVKDGSKHFLCQVGVPHFTPPELQGRDFSRVVRTANHDYFGLAVLLFLLLFMGRHPFAGRFSGAGEMPIEKAIAEHRFVYGANRAAVQMEQPPGTPSIEIASREVAQLFERAFARQSVGGMRPTAREWISALERLEKNLKQCAANQGHLHLGTLSACPWCDMEARAGVSLFPILVPTAGADTFSLDELWRQVLAIPNPGPAPVIEDVTILAAVKPDSNVAKLKSARVWRTLWTVVALAVLTGIALVATREPGARLLLIGGGLLGAFVANRAFDWSGKVEKLVRARDDGLRRWTQASTEWARRAGSDSFDQKRRELEQLRKELEALPSQRIIKLNDLRGRLRETQLEQFLDAHEIPAKGISGIGPARKAALESYGIETAADVVEQKLRSVPGIGPARLKALLQWRRQVEAKFKFNAAKGVNPQDQARIEQEILSQRQVLLVRTQKGIAELKQISNQINWARTNLRGEVEEQYRRFLQAGANATAIGR